MSPKPATTKGKGKGKGKAGAAAAQDALRVGALVARLDRATLEQLLRDAVLGGDVVTEDAVKDALPAHRRNPLAARVPVTESEQLVSTGPFARLSADETCLVLERLPLQDKLARRGWASGCYVLP